MPIIIHKTNIITLEDNWFSENNIKLKQDRMPKIGNNGTNGTLNGLFKFGSFFLKIITAMHIAINAVNVP